MGTKVVTVVGILIALYLIYKCFISEPTVSEPPERRAGREGERLATKVISRNLVEGDTLLNNIAFNFEGREAELDNVVINQHGVFIIEVKNYVGVLRGSEEDFEWDKYKSTGAGNSYAKKVKNPIKQVNRQVYLLSKYLQENGINAWVDGYVFLVNNNSPVKSNRVLATNKDIYTNLHTSRHATLDNYTINKIRMVLGQN